MSKEAFRYETDNKYKSSLKWLWFGKDYNFFFSAKNVLKCLVVLLKIEMIWGQPKKDKQEKQKQTNNKKA